VTVELSAEVLARLRAEAARRGVSIDDVITELAEQLPTDTTSEASLRPGRTLAFVAAGATAAGITTRMEQTLAEGFGRD
jgi:hypothetical protein